MKITSSDVALIRAAASLAAHAPEKMRAAHMAPRLEALARRLAADLPREAPVTRTEPALSRAARAPGRVDIRQSPTYIYSTLDMTGEIQRLSLPL